MEYLTVYWGMLRGGAVAASQVNKKNRRRLAKYGIMQYVRLLLVYLELTAAGNGFRR